MKIPFWLMLLKCKKTGLYSWLRISLWWWSKRQRVGGQSYLFTYRGCFKGYNWSDSWFTISSLQMLVNDFLIHETKGLASCLLKDLSSCFIFIQYTPLLMRIFRGIFKWVFNPWITLSSQLNSLFLKIFLQTFTFFVTHFLQLTELKEYYPNAEK